MSHSNYLRLVKHLKEDFSEEIPQITSHSLDQQPATKSKWKKAWFQLVSSILIYGVRNSHLPLAYMDRYYHFQQRNKETEFQQREITSEDIAYANKILDDIIDELTLE